MSERGKVLTTADIEGIKNPGESVFAKACLDKPHLIVKYQIPVGTKVIDFWVKNERVNGRSKGRLVEVTSVPTPNGEVIPEEDQSDNAKKLRHMKNSKEEQRAAMQESGLPFVILYGENLASIRSNLRKNRDRHQ